MTYTYTQAHVEWTAQQQKGMYAFRKLECSAISKNGGIGVDTDSWMIVAISTLADAGGIKGGEVVVVREDELVDSAGVDWRTWPVWRRSM